MAVTGKELQHAENVQKLMLNQKCIRNIGIVAHIHHGKCVSQDTRIILTDGSIRTAKEIFDIAKDLGVKTLEEDDKIIYDLSDRNLRIFSLNKNTGKIEKKRIHYAWKLSGGQVIKIKLRSGAELKTTPEHKYVALENGDFVDKPASELKLGDRIVCARKIECEHNLKIKSYILQKLSKKNFYVWLKSDFGAELKELVLSKGLERINEKIGSDKKHKSLYHGAWQNRYALADLLKLCEIFNLNLEEVYDKIEWLAFRKGKQRGRNSCKQKLPQNFEELFYLAGLFIGDGSGHKFVVGKPALAAKAIEILNAMQIRYYLRNYSYRTPEIGTNFTLMQILNALFDYPLKRKSHSVKVSDFVFNSPENLVAAFIRGYFDCDGTVEKSRRAISLSSASQRILKDLQLLLLRFGCMSIVQGDTIYISGQSAKIFAENVSFFLEEKQTKAIELARAAIGSYALDKITIAGKNQFLFGAKVLNSKLTTGDLAFIEVIGIEALEEDTVYDFTIPDNHNFVAEGIVVHNTTLTDNLAAEAGMMSSELVGERMLTWIDKQEHERLMTIYGATVTMGHKYKGEDYLINLLDTPGHVDFGADVTQALRAVDGAVVMACAVEGMMPQTETVLFQALQERVKPILFINKVDRAIKELKLTPQALQKRLLDLVVEINNFILKNVEPEFKDQWMLSVEKGTVAFGSALKKWAISVPAMKKFGITFKDIIDMCSQDRDDELAKRAPAHVVVLDMVGEHLPSPLEAQRYRIPRLWRGEPDSEIGKSLLACDPKGDLAAGITKVVYDQHAGMIATARIFSGKISEGQIVSLMKVKRDTKVQQLSTFIASRRIPIQSSVAGNVVGIVGLSDVAVGETLCEVGKEIEPFESIKHIFEPVVTKAIEPKNPQDLPKLIDILKILAAEDPTLKIKISPDTGETLVSGLGELHLDAKVERKIREKGLDIIVSPPVVVYTETVAKKSLEEVEGKSPNRHNLLFVKVEPLEAGVYQAIKAGKIPEGKIKKVKKDIIDSLATAGMDRDQAKQVVEIYGGNVLVEATRGIVHIGEIIEMVMQSFEEICDQGPMAKEPCYGLKVLLTDCKLHEDSIHRGPGQMIPCMRQAVTNAMLLAGDVLFEPVQTTRIDTPREYLTEVSNLIAGRRGLLLETTQQGTRFVVIAEIPVSEMFGFEAALKSASAGRGFQSLVDVKYKKLPSDLQLQTIMRIRERKGMSKEIPKPIFD